MFTHLDEQELVALIRLRSIYDWRKRRLAKFGGGWEPTCLYDLEDGDRQRVKRGGTHSLTDLLWEFVREECAMDDGFLSTDDGLFLLTPPLAERVLYGVYQSLSDMPDSLQSACREPVTREQLQEFVRVPATQRQSFDCQRKRCMVAEDIDAALRGFLHFPQRKPRKQKMVIARA